MVQRTSNYNSEQTITFAIFYHDRNMTVDLSLFTGYVWIIVINLKDMRIELFL